MELEKIIKKTAYTSLLASTVLAILGIIIFLYSEITMKIISYTLGVILLITGMIKIIEYIKEKGSYNVFNYELVYGIIIMVFGVIIVSNPSTIEGIIGIAVGIWIIYNSLMKFTLSLKLKNFEVKSWIPTLILSIIMMLCGIYIIFSPDVIIATLGIILFIYSLTDIVEEIIFLTKAKQIDE